MVDQNTFMETIHEVSEIIRISQGQMSREEILSYFKEMDLNEAQENMVLEFLLNPKNQEPQAAEEEAKASEETEDDNDMDEAADDEADIRAAAKKEGKEETVQEESSRALRLYLEELGSLKTQSNSELEELYRRLLAGDEAVITQISEAWLPRIPEMARRLLESQNGIEDVIQEGNMALFLKLTELCGAGTGIDVEEMLMSAASTAMKSNIIALEGTDEDENSVVGKVSLVSQAYDYMKSEKGSAPSLRELADYTHVPEAELAELLTLIQKAEGKKD